MTGFTPVMDFFCFTFYISDTPFIPAPKIRQASCQTAFGRVQR